MNIILNFSPRSFNGLFQDAINYGLKSPLVERREDLQVFVLAMEGDEVPEGEGEFEIIKVSEKGELNGKIPQGVIVVNGGKTP